MDAIPLGDIIKTYTGIYVNTQQVLTQLYFARGDMFRLHIQPNFRPAYNRTGPFYVRTIWDPTLFTYKVHVK